MFDSFGFREQGVSLRLRVTTQEGWPWPTLEWVPIVRGRATTHAELLADAEKQETTGRGEE
jgi:hypothetical protein